MPTRPVEVSNNFGTHKHNLTAVSNAGPVPGTLSIHFSYRILTTHIDAHWNGVVIDTLECLIVPAYLSDSQGMQLTNAAHILAVHSLSIASIGTVDFAGTGSVVLPASYFGFVSMPFVDSHRTWTLLVRTRGCRNVNGTMGTSDVLSCLALHADVEGLPVPVVMEPPLP